MSVIVDNYLIEEMRILKSSIELKLKDDSSNEFIGLVKNNIDLFDKTYKVGDYISCKSRVQKRKDGEVLNIIQTKKVQIDNTIDRDMYVKRFEKLMFEIVDKDYKILLENVFNNDDIRDLFYTYPATISLNHNYGHGLLQHTVEVCETAILLGKYYKDIDLDLLATGCLLHDIGKIQSFDYNDSNNRIVENDWEMLLGHLPISSLYVSKAVPENIDSHKSMILYHLVLSYKGENSPVDYKMRESFLLNQANNISKELNFGEWYVER